MRLSPHHRSRARRAGYWGLCVSAWAGATACTANDCGLHSTIEGYEPDCGAARIAFFVDETILFVPGIDGGSLEMVLPADPMAGDYGGTTGNPLTALVETEQGSWLAESRLARLTLDDPNSDPVAVDLTVEVDAGNVRGHTPFVAVGG